MTPPNLAAVNLVRKKMEDCNVALAIQNAKEKVVDRFGGSSNTLELHNSFSELFNNQKSFILINNIRGKCTAFEAVLTAKTSSPEKVDEIVQKCMLNNQEQLRIDTMQFKGVRTTEFEGNRLFNRV